MTELSTVCEDLPSSRSTRWITDKKICERYSVCRMTLYRWRRDPKMRFPQPINFNGYNRTQESRLDEFDRRVCESTEARPE